MIINCDETGLSIIPANNYTMDKKGKKQIPIQGKNDKRQITLVVSVTSSGELLPPQLIYPGKTEKSCPKDVKFSESWLIDFSLSHWTTEETFQRYTERILIPYIRKTRTELGNNSMKGLLLLDKFSVHIHSNSYKKLLKDENILLGFYSFFTN